MCVQLHSVGEAESVVDLSDVIPDDVEPVTDFRSGFPAGFKRARKAAALSQERFCEAFNKAFPNPADPTVSLETVRGWEQGRHLPRSIETLEKLCTFFSCSMDYLFNRTDYRDPTYQFVSDCTGLNAASLTSLQYFRRDKLTITVINHLLTDRYFWEKLADLFSSAFYQRDAEINGERFTPRFEMAAIWDPRFDSNAVCFAEFVEALNYSIDEFVKANSDDPDALTYMVFHFLKAYTDHESRQYSYYRIRRHSSKFTPNQLSYAVRFLLDCGFKRQMESDGFDYKAYIGGNGNG